MSLIGLIGDLDPVSAVNKTGSWDTESWSRLAALEKLVFSGVSCLTEEDEAEN